MNPETIKLLHLLADTIDRRFTREIRDAVPEWFELREGVRRILSATTEICQEDGCWSLYVNGRRVVDRESFAVVDRIRARLDNPAFDDHSEATEVARSIRKWVESNPV